jgi:hypothetical protein
MKYLLSVLALIFLSCKSKTADSHKDVLKHSDDEYFASDNHNATAYKMLYMNDYPYILSEKGFWENGKIGFDFAVHKTTVVNHRDLMVYFKTIDIQESHEGFKISYAFTFHDSKDTIYASYDLKDWLHKSVGKSFFYSEPVDYERKPFYERVEIDPFFRICN